MSKDNPLLEAYISEKEKENDKIISDWAQICRKHYIAFLFEGFTPNQSMRLVEYFWKIVNERNEQRREREKSDDTNKT